MDKQAICFDDKMGFGFIEYKDNSVFIYFETITGEKIEFELIKTDTSYKLKPLKKD